MSLPFGPATQAIQAITLAVVLALTALVVAASEPDRSASMRALTPSLPALAASQPTAALDIRVQLRASADRGSALAAIRRAGGVPLGLIATDLRARMNAASAEALSRHPAVVGVVVVSR